MDKRKHRRQALSYAATLTSEDGAWTQRCELVDVSQTGARVILDDAVDLPEALRLVLGQGGGPTRACRVIWREGGEMGVRFSAPKPDAENA